MLTPACRRDAQVKDFAKKAMKTTEVRVDVKLNKFLWSKGIRNVRAREASPCPGRRGPPLSAAPPRRRRCRAAFASRSPAAATMTRTPRRAP